MPGDEKFRQGADDEFRKLPNVKFLIWSLVGIGTSVGLIYLAYERSQPFIAERTVTVEEPVRNPIKKIVEVTIDGEKRNKAVDNEEMTIGKKQGKLVETYKSTWEQEPWFNLLKWIAIGALLFLALLMILWLSLFLPTGEKLPKQFDVAVKYLVVGMVGALLGVICSPKVASTDITSAQVTVERQQP